MACETQTCGIVEPVTCTPETGHLPNSNHRWQDCPSYADLDAVSRNGDS